MPPLDSREPACFPAVPSPSEEERAGLILEHMPQVALIARKIHAHIQGRVDYEDLVSAGTLGLIAAIDRFDPARQLKLKTYAEHKIRGAILDSLRSLDGVGRDDRKIAKQIAAATGELEQELSRPPTQDEIAQKVGITPLECSEALTAAAASKPLSLDCKIASKDGDATFADVTPDRASLSPERRFEEAEVHRLVSEAVAYLPSIAQRVMVLHYSHGLTLRKIAPILEMSEWQVQDLRRKAILELRNHLAFAGLISSVA